ncbi:MAG: alkaline phosphatase D family protein [Myxococcota bacterium]|nr:alkaline phosphatase D family protein [Myxococcota bacterium]
MTSPFGRREFLRLSSVAVVAGSGLLSACSTPDEPELPSTCGQEADDGGEALGLDPLLTPLDEALFPLPPQAGAMRSDSVLLWGYALGLESIELKVWRGGDEQRFLVLEREIELTEGYAKVDLQGLSAGLWYDYAWFAAADDGVTRRSTAGRFRTAFAAGCAEPIKVVATACTHRRYAPFHSLELMAEEQPDLFLQLGDMSYNDGARSQADYRQRWHEALSDPGYRALLPACGMYATWDDHEIVDSGTYYQTGETRRRIATEAWFETIAVPRLGGDRFWDSYTWGDTAEFFVLDCRSERQPATRRDADAIYLSRAQMDWLKQALKASQSVWKVIANSVPMTNWPPAMIVEGDRWEGYQAQRQELLDFIASEGIEGVLVVGGDFHCGGVSRLEPEGPSSVIFEVLVGPGANGGNPIGYLFQEGSEAERSRIFGQGQFAFLHHGMSTTTLDFDAQAKSVHVRFKDPENEALRFAATIFTDGRIVNG